MGEGLPTCLGGGLWGSSVCGGAGCTGDISRFFPRIDRILSGEAFNTIFGAQDEGFRNFVLDNCILDFYAEQVYLKPQVTNLKNKKLEVTANPKPQTKEFFF